MKLYFMKQSALDYIKANIGTLYMNYYQFDSPEWIYELFDYDPFEVFAEVPDFDLADVNQQPGEIDLQNCKILYSKLDMLSDSQASDERLWAGLCNKTFYSYMRKRWKYARRHLKKSTDDASAIMLRYFYKNSGRSGMFRNTLARCWWTGRLTYSGNPNHWERLDAIGAEDIVSKISDIFYSNTYSSNPVIVEGFCEGLKFFRERDIHVATREHIRPTAQYLNAIGGGILLDMLSANEIRNIVVDHIGSLIKGMDPGIISELNMDPDDAIDSGDFDGESIAEEVNVDFVSYIDSLERVEGIDLDKILGELTEVEYGCKVLIHKDPENTEHLVTIPMKGEELNLYQKRILGKSVGDEYRYNQSIYRIKEIMR